MSTSSREKEVKKTTIEFPEKLYNLKQDASEEEFLNMKYWIITAMKEKLERDGYIDKK